MKRGFKKVWDADIPLSSYAPSMQYRFRAMAEDLAEDLRTQRPRRVYVRVERDEKYDAGHFYIPTIEGSSPSWWREFFAQNAYKLTRRYGSGKPYERRRGPKHSKVSRFAMIKALEAIAEGEDLDVGKPVDVTREYGIGQMRYAHERNERDIRGRMSDTEGCEELFKYLQQHPRHGLPKLPMKHVRTIERVFGSGRINDARRAAGVPEEYIRGSRRGDSSKSSKTKRVSVRLLFAKTENKAFTRSQNSNHARARQLIFDRLTQGYYDEGHPVLPDRRVRNYFGIPLPPNYDGMLSDLRRERRDVRVRARVDSGEAGKVVGESIEEDEIMAESVVKGYKGRVVGDDIPPF